MLEAFLKPLPYAHFCLVAGKILHGHAMQLPVGPGLEPLVVVADRLDVVSPAHLSVIGHRP